jgi:hypothetical protein
MLLQYISLPVFFASFILGLIFIYTIGPDVKTIYVYPTPTNYSKIQYKDKTDQCFQFKPNETHCPINPLAIKTVPVQK